MTFKKISLFLFLLFSLVPTNSIFAQSSNVGFIPANIWYSKDPFEEGDKIKIYTLVFNPDARELSGTVVFFDNSTFLGKKDFKASPKSVKDIYIDWTVNAGDHTIFAKIENAKFLISKDKYEEVYVAENKTQESKRDVAKKIIADLPEKIINSVSNTAPVTGIKKTIKDNTPAFVTNTINSTTNFLEDIRESSKNSLENKKESVQKEIDILNKIKINKEAKIADDGTIKKGETVKEAVKSTETKNLAIKPFKQAEYFILTTLAFIFKNKIIFYGLIILIIFWILRFLWRLIF
jgi:hypothetical protein